MKNSRKIIGFYVVLSFFLVFFMPENKNFKKAFRTDNIMLLKFGGVRASEYGISPFPSAEEWTRYAVKMSQKFENFEPAIIWILGVTWDDGTCELSFPSDGKEYPYIEFSKKDENEEYLNFFDSRGIKVFLQVEPGNADVETLISLVLKRYGHHSCVVGFGVDVEWYKWNEYDEGKAVSDDEALKWVNKVLSFNRNYALFLKHWEIEKMPPDYRERLIFVNDSQDLGALGQMKIEFQNWANFFSPSPVAFQIGYESDKSWWQYYYDPAGTIGRELINIIPNLNGIFWVDFTLKDAFIKRKRGTR